MQASPSVGFTSLRVSTARSDTLQLEPDRAFSLRKQRSDRIHGSCCTNFPPLRLMKYIAYSSAIALALYPSFSLEAQIIPPEVKIVDDEIAKFNKCDEAPAWVNGFKCRDHDVAFE